MSNPRQHLYFMGIYLCVVAVVCALLYAPLKTAFMANWGFNLMILVALAVGIGINMDQVLRLEPELNWIKIFRTGEIGLSVTEPTRLMTPLAKHLEGLHRDRFTLSAFSLRTVLDGIRSRLDESREISHYMIGLLVFLGLLGTFWGLMSTISAVRQVIGGLQMGGSDFSGVFQTLKSGLERPLGGMGTAFSSSLFGLGGSLVLGFLDIQAGHAQNRFFNDLEEWLSGVTRFIDKTDGTDLDMRASGDMDGVQQRLELMILEMRAQTRAIGDLKRSLAAGEPPEPTKPTG